MYPKLSTYLQKLSISNLPNLLLYDINERYITICDAERHKIGTIDLLDMSLLHDALYVCKLISEIPYHKAVNGQDFILEFNDRSIVRLVDSKRNLVCSVLYTLKETTVVNVSQFKINNASKCFGLLKNIKTSVYNWLIKTFDIYPYEFTQKFDISKGLQNKLDERILVDILLHICPELEQNYLPSRTNEKCFYEYDPQSCIWNKAYESDIHELIASTFHKIDPEHKIKPNLPYTSFGQSVLTNSLYTKLASKKIQTTNLFNADCKVFAMKNCLCDFNNSPYVRRAIKKEDYIIQTTNWDYIEESASYYKADVENFFILLFPDHKERVLFLRWAAFILCADLRHKSFAILTDDQGGNNGKSKLLQFLQIFFGFYHISNPDFFNKPGIVATRDAHNAGLHLMNKKTLLLMDDLHEGTPLHFGQLKELVGGDITKSGRGIYSKDGFEFKWLASIIMAFNGNVCPSFNIKDLALCERMIVFPMKAKFMSSRSSFGGPEHINNTSIASNFPNWCSAFLNLLLENYSPGKYIQKEEFTPDMISMKEQILEGTLKYKMWLKGCIFEKTEITEEYVTLDKLYDRYIKFKNFTTNDYKRKFISYAKLWFEKNGVKMCNSHYNSVNEEDGIKRRCFKRSTVVGLKLEKPIVKYEPSQLDIKIK